MSKTVTVELPEELYDRFWECKNLATAAEGEAMTHTEAFEVMVDLWERDMRAQDIAGLKARIAASRATARVGESEVPDPRIEVQRAADCAAAMADEHGQQVDAQALREDLYDLMATCYVIDWGLYQGKGGL